MKGAVKRGMLAVVRRSPPPVARIVDTQAMLAALPVPVVLLDADNRFRYVNQAAEHFLGSSIAQLAHLALEDLIPSTIRSSC